VAESERHEAESAGGKVSTAGPSVGKRKRGRPRKRPRPVTLLAIWMMLAGAVSLLGAGTAFGVDTALRIGALSVDTVQKVHVSQWGLIVDGLLLLFGGAVEVTVGIGALRLKSWAWPLAVLVAVYDIVTKLWTLATDDFSWPVAIGAALAVVVLFYLQQEDVKRAFGRV
jgi:hypothetical protein